MRGQKKHKIYISYVKYIYLYKMSLVLGFNLQRNTVPAENTKIYYVFTPPSFEHAR